MINVLAEDDSNAARILDVEVANSVWPVYWISCDFCTPFRYLFEVIIHVANPLKQMHTGWVLLTLDEMNCRVISPHNSVIIISKVRSKAQNIPVVTYRCLNV